MSNVLSEEKKQQVIALGRLGWTLRRIEQATGVRRETAGAYLKAAGIAVRPPGGWGRRGPATPANEVVHRLKRVKTGQRGDHRPWQREFTKAGTPTSQYTILSQCLRALSRHHRAGSKPRAQCHGDLAGPG